MEHISNVEKARQIAESCSVMPPTPITQADVLAMTNNAAMQALELKDEQFQKVLDYAEICYGVFSFEQRKNFINHIKEIFYGKE